MKAIVLALLGMSIITFYSCSDNEPKNEPSNELLCETPILHDAIDVDLDEDGTIDYIIKYSEVDIEPLTLSDGVYGIQGSVQPVGQNEILNKHQESDLFLRDLDEIKPLVEDSLRWRSTFSSRVVSIATINAEGDWPDEWEVNANNEHDTYFLGLKIIDANGVRLGWLEIEIDSCDGIIRMVDKGML